MILIIYLVLLFDGIGNITSIAKENSVKSKAEEAFLAKDYATSIQYYNYLLDTLKINDEKAALNLSHAYFNQQKFAEASKNYEKLYNAKDKNVRSIAAQQLGVMSFKNDNDKPKALSYFKDALRANPTNKDARFNYEFLKRLQEAKQDPKMDNKKDDKKDDKDNKDQQNKDQQNKDSQNKDSQNKDDKNNKDGKDGKDKKDDKNNKDGKDKNNDKDNDKDNKDGKDGKDKKDGKNNDKTDKDNKNGTDKDNKDGKKDKEEEEKNKKDKEGEQNKQGKDADNKDAKQDQQGQAQKEKEGGKKEKPKMVANPESLAKMGMTDQRAKMLLDAMKSNEIQYIQQNKREATKKNSNKGKPDW